MLVTKVRAVNGRLVTPLAVRELERTPPGTLYPFGIVNDKLVGVHTDSISRPT